MNKQLKTTVLFEKKHYKNTKYTVDVSQIKNYLSDSQFKQNNYSPGAP